MMIPNTDPAVGALATAYPEVFGQHLRGHP